MTTPATGRQLTSACNGVTTVFPCPVFRVASELKVYLLDNPDDDDTSGTLLTQDVDYTVAGDGMAGTASITTITAVPFPFGQYLRRKRFTSLAQTNDYVPNDGFPAASHEAALDRLSLVDEELADDIATATTKLAAQLDEGLAEVDEKMDTANDLLLQTVANQPSHQIDLFLTIGQSLTLAGAPQVTLAGRVPSTLLMFNGGSEAYLANAPAPLNYDYGIPSANFSAMVPFLAPANAEGHGPGIGYQSAKAGVARSFFFAAGHGGYSLSLLSKGAMSTLTNALRCAVRNARALGYAPNLYIIIDHGQADADALDDGGNGGYPPTTQAQYANACGKIVARLRKAAAQALGIAGYTAPVWVVPMITQNLVATLNARRDIIQAQAGMPTTSPGVRLLPPRSQFANLFETDLVHLWGQGQRNYAELIGAYVRSGLTPPRMIAKAVVGGTVEVTFDQPIAMSATLADMAVPGNSKGGFTVIDNAAAEVAVTGVAVAGSKATLTVASVANLNGGWKVRNGLQLTGVIGVNGVPASYMPRTMIVGTVNVGVTEAGIALENFSIPQEL
jgi:hypothetical protein